MLGNKVKSLALGLLAQAYIRAIEAAKTGQPNIIVVMSDDQDLELGSFDTQEAIQRELVGQGITLDNHFATVAQCCPSRTSFLRGQAAHNTNLTHVSAPGGGWEKFVASGQDKNYLPIWLQNAGYRTEYIGKLMNGYNMATYQPKPNGWDYTDVLLNPYVYIYNNVVMSKNGQRPIFYDGYHQADVIRAKALDRVGSMIQTGEPYYIQIAPAVGHAAPDGPSVPLSRHMWSFNDAKAVRNPNFNPSDEFQNQKPSWLKELPRLTDDQVEFIDWQHRQRLQSYKGVDEIVEDIIELLREKDELDNTYVIYTTDNGFHEGTHRQIGGKGLPYIEDTHIPMVIRGPGIPAGVTSKMPSSHIDMAPTFLEIAGVAEEDQPPFFDGRSLLSDWHRDRETEGDSEMAGAEVLHVEWWGTVNNVGLPNYQHRSEIYAYKTVRIMGQHSSAWLFSRWCEANSTELYNTIEDPYELTNLALNPSASDKQVMSRLEAVLLVTKSCHQESCRSPWKTLSDGFTSSTISSNSTGFSNLQEALDPRFDDFFASLPTAGFQACLDYQSTDNEGPYYPEESISLGREWRDDTDHFLVHTTNGTNVPGNFGRAGSIEHRHVTLATIMESAREVTDAELGTKKECGPDTDYCGELPGKTRRLYGLFALLALPISAGGLAFWYSKRRGHVWFKGNGKGINPSWRRLRVGKTG